MTKTEAMLENITVSVIVPAYNNEKHIVECITSLLGQSHRNLEVLLIDDGSTDKTKTTCQRFERDERFKYLYQSNKGASEARNKALDLARGDYICFVDSDDYVEVDYIKNMLLACVDNDCDLCECGYRTVDENHVTLENHDFKNHIQKKQKELMRSFLLYANASDILCNKLFKATLIAEHRFKPYCCSEDFDFLVRIHRQSKGKATISGILYNYVRHDGAVGLSQFSPKKLDVIYVREKIYQDFKNLLEAENANIIALQIVSRIIDLYQEADRQSKKELRKKFFFYVKDAQKVKSNPKTNWLRRLKFVLFALLPELTSKIT